MDSFRTWPAKTIVVEASLADLLNHPRTQLSRESIMGTLAAWQARFCPIFFAGNRHHAADFLRRFLMCEARRLYSISQAFQTATDGRKERA